MKKALCLGLAMATAAMLQAEELSLKQAIEIALKNNASIHSARYKVEAAVGQTWAARGNLVPQLAATGSALRLNSLMEMGAGDVYYLRVLDGSTFAPTGDVVPMAGLNIISDKIGNTYAGKLSATWPIYTGGKIWQGYQISRLSLESVRREYDTTRAGVVLSVKQSYYDLLLAQRALDVIRDADSTIQRHVDRVTALYKRGMVSKLDLLRAEVQKSNIQPQIIGMENAVNLARQSLNLVLNRDLTAELIPTDSLEFLPMAADSQALVRKALANRPELAQIEIARRISNRARMISYSGYQPNVVLMADYSTNKGAGFTETDVWKKNWDVGVAVSWTLFDGFSTMGRIKEAANNARRVRVGREQVEDYIRLEVMANYLTLRANEKTIASQEKVVEQAAEALKMAQARYESGQATNLDVLDAQLALTQAETNHFQSVHDYLVALARLEKAVATTLTD